jgi:dTDP-4-dehydrorhamnose 3,5-epimerase
MLRVCHLPGEARRRPVYNPRALKVTSTAIPGVLILEPKVFSDDRGFFMETYNERMFRDTGITEPFVQDNHSRSRKNVVRGLHYQLPEPQGKLVRCTRGALFDVAVDIRRGSPTFGTSVGVELSEENRLLLWVPAGLAHGFCALTDWADLVYKCTTLYDAKGDRSIAWNDPELAIPWPVAAADALLSAKDAAAPNLADADLPD